MLVDFITARVDLERFCEADQARLRLHGERIVKFSPTTGVVSWECSTWDSIRSDSHQISVRVTSDALMVKGSPARVIGDGDAAFGSGAARALDLPGCVERMACFVGGQLAVTVPAVQCWSISRTDTTSMLLLPSLADVRAALTILRNCEGGRYKVENKAGDTVSWGGKSRLKKAKAYAKGPHLRFATTQKGYQGVIYTRLWPFSA